MINGTKRLQYKGTPHPRKRKPLDVITNNHCALGNTEAIAVSQGPAARTSNIKKQADKEKDGAAKRLQATQASMMRLLEKISCFIQRKKLLEKLSPMELDNFQKEMSGVQATLQERHDFFLQAAKRTRAPEEPVRNFLPNGLIPFVPSVNKKVLSDSPLVPSARHESRKILHFTPEISPSRSRRVTTPSTSKSSIKKVRFGTPSASNKKVTFASSPLSITPLMPRPAKQRGPSSSSITPVMPSPPRSVEQRGPSSSSSSMSTPSDLGTMDSVPSSKLSTPQAPEDIISKYSQWLCSTSPAAKDSAGTPAFLSPPKTCALIHSDGPGEELGSPAPALMSPFRTPGLLLQSPSSVETVTLEPSSASVDEVSSKLAAASL